MSLETHTHFHYPIGNIWVCDVAFNENTAGKIGAYFFQKLNMEKLTPKLLPSRKQVLVG